jgi:hypothetical protein
MHDSAKIDAAQMLHRVQVQHGLQQWRTEAARLHALFERTRDPKHLLAHQRLSAAISKWERRLES